MQIEPVEAPLNSGTEPISWTSLGHRSDWYIFPNYWTRSGQLRIPVRFHLWGFPLSGHRSFDWIPGQRWCNFSTWTPCLRRSLPNQLGLKWLHQNTWSQTLLCLGLVQCSYTNFQPIQHFWFIGLECYLVLITVFARRSTFYDFEIKQLIQVTLSANSVWKLHWWTNLTDRKVPGP